jgi:hypothetical protein
MKTNPNSPAFARATENPNLVGLTKREYFAAAALTGLFAKDVSRQTPLRMQFRWPMI